MTANLKPFFNSIPRPLYIRNQITPHHKKKKKQIKKILNKTMETNKTWTRLIAFHIALIPLEKVWIQLFSL